MFPTFKLYVQRHPRMVSVGGVLIFGLVASLWIFYFFPRPFAPQTIVDTQDTQKKATTIEFPAVVRAVHGSLVQIEQSSILAPEKSTASVQGAGMQKILKVNAQTEIAQFVPKDSEVFANEVATFNTRLKEKGRSDTPMEHTMPTPYTEQTASKDALTRGMVVLVTTDERSADKRDIIPYKITILPESLVALLQGEKRP